jgi:OPT family oligopeptide transporter
LLDDSNNDEQSLYKEVAINVSNKDDPEMLCLTIRSVFIGILLTCIMAFTYQFFAFRTSPMDLNIGSVILIAYMFGKLLSKILPEKLFKIPLNPGPFTVKELALITIMATSGSFTLYAIEAITIQRVYYNFYLSAYSAIMYIVLMHLIAFSIAGMLNRFLIWPGAMIWPKTLMSCCLMRTLNAEDEMEKTKSHWTMKRFTFFWWVVLAQFIYYWFPGYIFPLLSFFSFICLFAPDKILLSQITGAYGLGVGAIELDWNSLVAYLDSPILVPFWYIYFCFNKKIL